MQQTQEWTERDVQALIKRRWFDVAFGRFEDDTAAVALAQRLDVRALDQHIDVLTTWSTHPHIELGPDLVQICRDRLPKACFGGRSNISGERRDIDCPTLKANNLTGLLGHLAAAIYMLGRECGINDFIAQRRKCDEDQYAGDDTDILAYGTRIDVKSSRVQDGCERHVLDFRLPVQPAEFHENTLYILAIVREVGSNHYCVYLPGCLASKNFSRRLYYSRTFDGVYLARYDDLVPLPRAREVYPEFFGLSSIDASTTSIIQPAASAAAQN